MKVYAFDVDETLEISNVPDCWETAKEDGLRVLEKMDAVNLTGVWPNFPQGAVAGGRLTWAAGIYLWLLEEERRRKKGRYEEPEKLRDRLLEEVRKRIVQRDEDDLFAVLAV